MTTLVSLTKYLIWLCMQGSFLTNSMMLTNVLKNYLQLQQQKESMYCFTQGSFIKQTMAQEDQRIFFFISGRAMLRRPVKTQQVTNFQQDIIQGQLKVGITQTKSALAALKSLTMSLQIPSYTFNLFFLSQSPPFSNNRQH